jgi:hypothetical protein
MKTCTQGHETADTVDKDTGRTRQLGRVGTIENVWLRPPNGTGMAVQPKTCAIGHRIAKTMKEAPDTEWPERAKMALVVRHGSGMARVPKT